VIDLQLQPGGVVLPVRAQPGARSAAIRGEQNDSHAHRDTLPVFV
jgi:hypothetical protein